MFVVVPDALTILSSRKGGTGKGTDAAVPNVPKCALQCAKLTKPNKPNLT